MTASAAKRREYIRWASEPGRYIVEDDFSSEFTASSKPDETVFSLAERGNILYLNTFSQTVAPSLRMGYMVLSEPLAAQYAERIGFYSCTVPLFEQLVLAELSATSAAPAALSGAARKNERGLRLPGSRRLFITYFSR